MQFVGHHLVPVVVNGMLSSCKICLSLVFAQSRMLLFSPDHRAFEGSPWRLIRDVEEKKTELVLQRNLDP